MRRLQTPGGSRSKRRERERLEKLRGKPTFQLSVLGLAAAGSTTLQSKGTQCCRQSLPQLAHTHNPPREKAHCETAGCLAIVLTILTVSLTVCVRKTQNNVLGLWLIQF